MKTTGYKRWFEQRFVVLTEIAGYLMAVVVGAFVVYSVSVRVDVVVSANGTLHPPFIDVRADAEAVLIKYIVSSGQEVTAGQEVCRVVLDPSAQRRILTRRQLESVVAMLEAEVDTQSDTLENARKALATLPSTEDSVALKAPEGGWLKHTVALDEGVVSPKQPIARIYDLKQLVMETTVSAASDAKHTVAEGMEVRVTLEGLAEPIVGNVTVAADAGDEQRKVTIRFKDLPADCRDHFRVLAFGRDKDAFPSVKAEITAGSRSLFSKIFAK